MTRPWERVLASGADVSYNAPVEWSHTIPEPDDDLTEDVIKQDDPQWTPPPDLWRPQRTLGPIDLDGSNFD